MCRLVVIVANLSLRHEAVKRVGSEGKNVLANELCQRHAHTLEDDYVSKSKCQKTTAASGANQAGTSFLRSVALTVTGFGHFGWNLLRFEYGLVRSALVPPPP
jgi:hypothetical protein